MAMKWISNISKDCCFVRECSPMRGINFKTITAPILFVIPTDIPAGIDI